MCNQWSCGNWNKGRWNGPLTCNFEIFVWIYQIIIYQFFSKCFSWNAKLCHFFFDGKDRSKRLHLLFWKTKNEAQFQNDMNFDFWRKKKKKAKVKSNIPLSQWIDFNEMIMMYLCSSIQLFKIQKLIGILLFNASILISHRIWVVTTLKFKKKFHCIRSFIRLRNLFKLIGVICNWLDPKEFAHRMRIICTFTFLYGLYFKLKFIIFNLQCDCF